MNNYRQCNRCIMDTTAESIVFDNHGNCNYCTDFLKKLDNPRALVNQSNSLIQFISKIKKDGRGKDYDCIVGLSGGADSSYTLHLVKEQGLRPLAVHMDNGWNSELATNNIKNLVEKLDVHLYTHVIDWEEYKALMQAFFDANVIDVELLYDNAMLAVNYNLAEKYNIKYILSGTNTMTEGMRIPLNWNWYKNDKKNIYCLAKRNEVKIRTMPTFGTLRFLYCTFIKKIQWVRFLDYFQYNKEDAMNFLASEYAYKKYPYKHYESIFTRFYQGFILPKKFDVDKRKLHLSTLICTNQLSREEALDKMKENPYFSESDLQVDTEFFLKKMGWSEKKLDEYLAIPEIRHSNYATEKPIFDFLIRIYCFLKINK